MYYRTAASYSLSSVNKTSLSWSRNTNQVFYFLMHAYFGILWKKKREKLSKLKSIIINDLLTIP